MCVVCIRYVTLEPLVATTQVRARWAGYVHTIRRRIFSQLCANCPKGTFSAVSGSSECTPCEAGSYQELTGESDCRRVALGTFNGATGATRVARIVCNVLLGALQMTQVPRAAHRVPQEQSRLLQERRPAQHVVLVFIRRVVPSIARRGPAGTKGDASAGAIMASSTDCIACEPGEFAASTGQAVCQPCPDGSYSDQAGMSECTKCPVGYTGRVAPQVERVLILLVRHVPLARIPR